MIFWCNFLDLSLFFYPSLAFSQSADCYNEYNHSLHATYCNGALQAFCSRDRRLEASEKNVEIDRIRCGAIKFATGQLLKCSRRSKRGQLLKKYDFNFYSSNSCCRITDFFKIVSTVSLHMLDLHQILFSSAMTLSQYSLEKYQGLSELIIILRNFLFLSYLLTCFLLIPLTLASLRLSFQQVSTI